MSSVDEIATFLQMEAEDTTGSFFSRNYVRLDESIDTSPQIGKIIAVYDDGFMLIRLIDLGDVDIERGYLDENCPDIPLAKLSEELIQVPVAMYGDLNTAFMSSPIAYRSKRNALFRIFDDGNRNDDVLDEL